MDATPLEVLRRPHPNQSRLDRWSAEMLRQTAALLPRQNSTLGNPRAGLVPALRQPESPPDEGKSS